MNAGRSARRSCPRDCICAIAPWRAWRSGTPACCRWPPNPCTRTGTRAARRRGARPRWASRRPFAPAPPTAISRAPARLLFNRCMFLRIPHDFRAGVLHFDLARHQADQACRRSAPGRRSRSTRPAGTRTPESRRAGCRPTCRRSSGTGLRSAAARIADFGLVPCRLAL